MERIMTKLREVADDLNRLDPKLKDNARDFLGRLESKLNPDESFIWTVYLLEVADGRKAELLRYLREAEELAQNAIEKSGGLQSNQGHILTASEYVAASELLEASLSGSMIKPSKQQSEGLFAGMPKDEFVPEIVRIIRWNYDDPVE